MKKTITRILAIVAAFVCGGAWAAAPRADVVFQSFTDGMQVTGKSGKVYTFSLGSGNSINSDGQIEIGADSQIGARFTADGGLGSKITLLIKYAAMPVSDAAVVSVFEDNADGNGKCYPGARWRSGTATDLVGFYEDNQERTYYFSSGGGGADNSSPDPQTGAGYLLFSYDLAAGTGCYAGSALSSLAGGYLTDLKFGYRENYGFAVGGPYTDSFYGACAGMKIEKIAVFLGKYHAGTSVADYARWVWPTEVESEDHEVIALNFNAGQGRDDAGNLTNNKLGDGVDAGVPGLLIPGKGWTQTTTANPTSAQNLFVYNMVSGENVTTYSSTPNATWTCRNHWSAGGCDCVNILQGYLDDINPSTITVNDIPFATYDAIVIFSTDDGGNDAWGHVEVNGTNYTYDENGLKQGFDKWGYHHNGTIDYGVNAMKVTGLTTTESNKQLTIRAYKDSDSRACLAGLVLVGPEVQADVLEIDATEGDAEKDFAGEAITKDRIALVGSHKVTLKNINTADLDKIYTVGFTGDIEFYFDCKNNAMTVDDTLKAYIKNASSNVTFVFEGSGENGATIEQTGTFTLNTHIVFKNGKHTYKHANGDRHFGANATDENPTLLVTDGATVDFYGKDTTGYNTRFGAAGVIRVDHGSTLKIIKYDGTFYWKQRFVLEPGSTLTFDGFSSGDVRICGGVPTDSDQFFVPAYDASVHGLSNKVTINCRENNALSCGKSGEGLGFSANVGAGSVLHFSGKLVNGKGRGTGTNTFTKRGAGTVYFTGLSDFTGGLNIEAGTVLGGANNNYDSNGNAAFGKNTNTITIGENGILDFNDNPVPGGYRIVSNGGTIKKTGTNGDANSQYIKSLTLNADTTLEATKVLGVGVANDAVSTLALGTSTLNVSVSQAQDEATHNFFLRNTTVTGTGTINITEGNLLLYGAGSVASEATISLGEGVTVEAQQNLTVKNLAWNGGNVSVSSGKSVTVSGAFTATINADKAFPNVTLANDATSITKAGTGKLKVSSDKLANFTGSIAVLDGSIDFGAVRPTQAISFTEGTAIYLTSNAADEGEATLSHVTGTPIVYMNGSRVDGATVTDGVLKVPYEIVVSGGACLYDWTFTNSLASVGIYKNSLTWDTGYTASNGYLTDADKFVYRTALNTKATPHVPNDWNMVYPAEWTCMIAGIMPAVDNGPLIVFGTTGGGSIALLSTGATEVKLVRTTGNSAYTDLATMEVPNARTASHAYTFVKTPTSITVYLDGKFWNSTAVSNPTFGAKLQVGSIHGGKGDTNIESSKNATNATAIQAVRIMEGAAGPKTAKKFADEFPYVSPSGNYERTFAANADQLWKDEANKWMSSKQAEAEGVAVPEQGIVTATFAGETTVTINNTAVYSYETLTIEGTGPVTFKKGEGESPKVVKSAETVIKTDVVLGERSIDLTGGITTIKDGATLTFDFSDLTAAVIAANSPFKVTGVIDQDHNIGTANTKLKIKRSESLDERIALALEYDSVGKFYKVVATAEAGTVYPTTTSFDTFKTLDSSDTALFPGDTVCIKYGIFMDSQRWNIPLDAAVLSGHKVVVDYANTASVEAGFNIGTSIAANTTLGIAEGTVGYFRENNLTINDGVTIEGAGTLGLNCPVIISGAVTISSNIDTSNANGQFTLSDHATLKVPAALASGKVLSAVETKMPAFDDETKTYSLVDVVATVDGVKCATLDAAFALAKDRDDQVVTLTKNVTGDLSIPTGVKAVNAGTYAISGEIVIPSGSTLTVSGDRTTNGISGEGVLVSTSGTLYAKNKASGYAIEGVTVKIEGGTVRLETGTEGCFATGASDSTIKNVTFIVADDATLTNWGWVNLEGTITLDIATEKTVFNGASFRGAPTIVKTGKGAVTFNLGAASDDTNPKLTKLTLYAGSFKIKSSVTIETKPEMATTTTEGDWTTYAAIITPTTDGLVINVTDADVTIEKNGAVVEDANGTIPNDTGVYTVKKTVDGVTVNIAEVAVIKVKDAETDEKPSAVTTAVAVPFASLSGGAVTVDSLLNKALLNEGDEIIAWNRVYKRYDAWSMSKGSWGSSTTVTKDSDTASVPASSYDLFPGQAVWVRTAGKVVLYGTLPAADITKVTASTGVNLLSNTAMVEATPAAEPGDVVEIPGDQTGVRQYEKTADGWKGTKKVPVMVDGEQLVIDGVKVWKTESTTDAPSVLAGRGYFLKRPETQSTTES